MIRGLGYFIQLVLLVLAAVWLAEQRGAVSIQWHGRLIETSAGVLILIVILAALVLLVLWRLWRSLWGTPHAIGRLRHRRKRARGYTALLRSLHALASGEGPLALRHASDAEAVGEPAVSHLAAANAAEMAGDLPRAHAEYTRLKDRPDTALIGLKGLAGLAEKKGDLTRARELVQQARKIAPKSPWAARALFSLQTRTGAFAEAEKTLAEAVKTGAVTSTEADPLLARLLVDRALQLEAAGKDTEALSDAERANQLDPTLSDAAALGVRLLTRSGRTPAAERMLTRSWAAKPGRSLARAWMTLAPKTDTTARLRQAERLNGLLHDSEEGRLALAEAELAAGRWAEARGHLTGLIAAKPGGAANTRYCSLMAYLEAASGNEAAARDWFEKSLREPTLNDEA
jgi:HemY protein